MTDRPQLLFVFAGPGPRQRRWLGPWLKAARHLSLTCVLNVQDDPQAWHGWAFRPHPGSPWALVSTGASPALCAGLLAAALGSGEVGVILPRGTTPEDL